MPAADRGDNPQHTIHRVPRLRKMGALISGRDGREPPWPTICDGLNATTNAERRVVGGNRLHDVRELHAIRVRDRARPRPPFPISFVDQGDTGKRSAAELPPEARQFAAGQWLCGQAGKCLTLPAPDGEHRAGAVRPGGRGQQVARSCSGPAPCPACCRPGVYRFANAPHDTRLAALAFALGSYRFSRYRKSGSADVRLVPPDGVDVADITRMAEAASLARDLINTPANDMGPEELAEAAQRLAQRLRRRVPLHRRRRAADAELSADPRGRHAPRRARRG